MDRAQRKPTLGVRPPDPLRHAAIRLESELGSTGAARELGISTETLARIIAGLGVRPGSIALAEARFAQVSPPSRKTTSKKSAA